jgi:hypothetical protein
VAVVTVPIALVSAAALVFLSGCGSHTASNRQESTATSGTEGSGVLATQSRNVADFTRLDLAVTGVRADRFKVDLSGAGRLEVTAPPPRFEASLPGGGAARLGRLLSTATHVVVSGTGSATVVVTKSLDASVSGTGSVTNHGNPQHIKTSVTGTGAAVPD